MVKAEMLSRLQYSSENNNLKLEDTFDEIEKVSHLVYPLTAICWFKSLVKFLATQATHYSKR